MTKEFIDEAINKALNGATGLDPAITGIRGFSTYTIRNLFHALCDTGEPITYLEIGLFCGASFCATFNENVTAIGIEDHSQDFSAGFEQVKAELKQNLELFSGKAKEVVVHYEDCFAIDKNKIPDNIDVYFMDGFHSFETQSKALPEFLDKMADRFIFLVDDYFWDYVMAGTEKGMEDLKDKIEIEHKWVLGDGSNNHPIWHNGIAIYLIKKK